jgi:hypothetical protein
MDNPEKWVTLGNNTERWRKKKPTKPPNEKRKKTNKQQGQISR